MTNHPDSQRGGDGPDTFMSWLLFVWFCVAAFLWFAAATHYIWQDDWNRAQAGTMASFLTFTWVMAFVASIAHEALRIQRDKFKK